MEIQLNNITKKFKKGSKALNDINFTLQENTVVGLLGENGAGKTTLMDIISTLQQPTTGEVTYSIGTENNIKENIGYMPQEFGMYSQLSVEDNIRYFGYLHDISSTKLEKRISYLLDMLHLSEHRRKKYKQLSGGMKRRVGLAVALIHDPEFLIIDEPTAGVDPEERSSIREFVMELGLSKTVLFSTHIIEDIEQISDRVIILKHGTILFEGEINALLSQYEGDFYEISDNKELPATAIVLKRYKTKNEAKAVIYAPNHLLQECGNAIPIETTLENCYLILNGGK